MKKQTITHYILFTFFALLVFITPTANASAEATKNIVEKCGNITIPIKHYGAGLMQQLSPIKIDDEHITTINVTERCAVIAWKTDKISTSQIIFGEADARISMDATKKNLGFPLATTQNNGADVLHYAILHNLKPGKRYVYRAVVRSHPSAIPSVGKEQTFTMPTLSARIIPPVFAPVAKTQNKTTTAITPIPPTITTNTNRGKTQYRSTISKTRKYTSTQYLTNSKKQQEIQKNKDQAEQQDEEIQELDYTDQTKEGLEKLTGVPSAITAAKQIDNNKSTILKRIKKAFTFFKTNKTNKEETLKVRPERKNKPIHLLSFINRMGFVTPTLFIILFIFFLQKLALPFFGIIVERPALFWMLSVIIAGLASVALKYYKIGFVMVAIFLAILAWYLLSESNTDESERNKKQTS